MTLATAMLENIRANEGAFHEHGYDIDFDEIVDSSTAAGQQLTRWRSSVNEALSLDNTFATKTAINTDPDTERVTIVVRWSRVRRDSNQNTSFRQVVLESAI